MKRAEESNVPVIAGARVESRGRVEFTVPMPTTRYMDQLLEMRCREELLRNSVFPNAKEMTESFAAADAAIHRTGVDPRRDAVTAIVVGDGSTPRTAATLALRTCWRTISVDPALRVDRVAEWPFPIGRLELEPTKIQAVDMALSGDCVVVLVHAHVGLERAIQAVRRCHGNPVAAVAIGCCGVEHRAPGMSLSADYLDWGIWSPERRVKVWRSVAGRESSGSQRDQGAEGGLP